MSENDGKGREGEKADRVGDAVNIPSGKREIDGVLE